MSNNSLVGYENVDVVAIAFRRFGVALMIYCATEQIRLIILHITRRRSGPQNCWSDGYVVIYTKSCQ